MPAKIRQNSASINDFLKPNSSLKTASRMWFNDCMRRLAVNTVFSAKDIVQTEKMVANRTALTSTQTPLFEVNLMDSGFSAMQKPGFSV
jgi:hypothetical protein